MKKRAVLAEASEVSSGGIEVATLVQETSREILLFFDFAQRVVF